VSLLTDPDHRGYSNVQQAVVPELSSNSSVSFHQISPQSVLSQDNLRSQHGAVSCQKFGPSPLNLPASEEFFTPQSCRSGFEVETQEADFLLLEFRTQMSPQFPFIVIPPDATAETLCQERPMVWKAIMTAASYHNASRQEDLGWKLMEEFSQRLLLRAEKSLDLLQAVLIHISWCVTFERNSLFFIYFLISTPSDIYRWPSDNQIGTITIRL